MPAIAPKIEEQSFAQALDDAVNAIRRNSASIGDANPKLGNANLQWDYCGESDWVAGFWAGQLWLCYQITNEPQFRTAAQQRHAYFARLLEHPQWHDHDLGFQLLLTAVADYKLTGAAQGRAMGLQAAASLLQRFRPEGGYIVAWNDTHALGAQKTRGKTIIDSIQNIALLFWAERETNQAAYRDAALAQADTIQRYMIRSDFSTFHTFDFDPETHRPVGGETLQGFADESCWSRGQAWAVHGFAQTAMNSGDAKYLQVAKNLADYVIDHLPDDAIPLWDYRLPDDAPVYRDSSAGAITAAGMLLIARQCDNVSEADRYKHYGLRMLAALRQHCDLSANPRALGLLDEGASYVGIGLCRNMLPYGDYYYLEALMRANDYTDFFW